MPDIRGLTIQQPYASLITLPDDDARAKRVENRTWAANWRGVLLIHAGKGKDYLQGDNYGLDAKTLPFGAVVGVAKLVGCVPVTNGTHRSCTDPEVPDWAKRQWPWLATHEHTEGPVCWVLQECRAFPSPIVCSGQRNLWVPDKALYDAVLVELEKMAYPM